MKVKYFLIAIIILIASFFRIFQIGYSPSGFYIDEAAIGYNAYSLLKTGKDEFGKSSPVLFRSFTDFKAPVYEYLLIPIYSIFDMSVITTRLPAVVAGILSVIIFYLLIFETTKANYFSLTSAFLLAISPWHILFSRTTYEISLALLFLLLSIWCFYKAQYNSKFFLLTSFFASLSILTYHAQRIISPLLFLSLIIINRKWIFQRKNQKMIIFSIIIGFLMIFPLLLIFNTNGFNSRLTTLSIFSNDRYPYGYNPDLSGLEFKVLNYRPLLLIKEWLSLYLSYFSPRYLFEIGDPGGLSSLVDTSPLFLWQLIFWILGIYKFFISKLYRVNFGQILLLFLLISPIPASFTGDPFSSIRSLPMVIPHLMLVAIGLDFVFNKLSIIKYSVFFRFIFILIFSILVIYSLLRLYFSIFVFMNPLRNNYWNYGAQELFNEISKYNKPTVIENSRDELYILGLFFTKFDPKIYQSQNFEVSSKEYYTNMYRNPNKIVGNIELRSIDWNLDVRKDQIIVADDLVFDPDDFQIKEHCLTKLFQIKNSQQQVLYTGVQTNPELKKKYGSCHNL